MKKVNFATPPDKWSGWRYDNERNIDYSIDNREYLQERKEFLMKNVIDEDSDKILKEIESYSNRQILAWGCGSGKTTKLKYFCANTDSSTIVVVRTNEEIQKLVFDITALNPKQTICAFYDDDNVLNKLEEDIEYLHKFKVIVCNNWRFLNEDKDIFMKYKTEDEIKNREYVFFDEFPEVSESRVIDTNKLIYFIFRRNKDLLMSLCDNFKNNQVKESFFCRDFYKYVLNVRVSSKLEECRCRYISNKIFNVISSTPNILMFLDKIEIITDITKIIPEKTKTIILDATGHIIFHKQNTMWKVDEYKQKKISISKLNYFGLSLHRKSNARLKKQDEMFNKDIERLNQFLRQSSSRKHLIVTWKNSRGYDDIPQKIRDKINKELSIEYEIIHYNSGECRATNRYKEFDSIIFFGEWFYSSKATNQLSEILNTNINSSNIALSEIIQAVFRTRAREGLPIELTFFYNLSEELINDIDNFDKLLIKISDKDCTNEIIFKHHLLCAEYSSNKNTFKKINVFIDEYNINSIGGDILVKFSDLKNKLGYSSIRDSKPLVIAMKEYFGINLIIEK